jgi:hypothetical protein
LVTKVSIVIVTEGRKMISMENMKPQIDGIAFPIKRIVSEKVLAQLESF